MVSKYKHSSNRKSILHLIRYISMPLLVVLIFGLHISNAAAPLSLIGQLNNIRLLLSQVGPILSALLFIIAGIFYAIGQILPPDKRANFHTASINIIIGAIVVGVLSFASTSLANASAHLLVNMTSNTV